MQKYYFSLLIILIIISCATSVPLPTNVSLSNNYIESISFEYPIERKDIDAFKMAKICIAENITNEEVFVSDSSKSFVGSYTGNLYSISSEKQIEGGQVIRMYDEDLKTVVARGNHKYNKTVGLLPMDFFLRYTIKMHFHEKLLKIRFSNIERASRNTGSLSNSGFKQVGNWPGARPEEVYAELEGLSKRLTLCVD